MNMVINRINGILVKIKIVLSITFIILFFFVLFSSINLINKAESNISVSQNWYFFKTQKSISKPSDLKNEKWGKINNLKIDEESAGYNVWIKQDLKSIPNYKSILLVDCTCNEFEVFIDNTLIYNLPSKFYTNYPFILIDTKGIKGNTLYIKFVAHEQNLHLSSILFGENGLIRLESMKVQIATVDFSIVMFIISLIFVIIYCLIDKEKRKIIGYFSAFVFLSGLWNLPNEIIYSIYPFENNVIIKLQYACAFLCPLLGFRFNLELTKKDETTIQYRIKDTLINFYTIVMLLMASTMFFTINFNMFVYFGIITIVILFSLLIPDKANSLRDTKEKIIYYFAIYAVALSLVYFQFTANYLSINLGIVLFIISMLVIFVLRFIKQHEQIADYAKSLEQKAFEIENLNKSLEQKVEQKTEELVNANKELFSTNDELINLNNELFTAISTLRDTQIQLVQTEKISSIMQLTAGIVHEFNTPLGSLKSNYDFLTKLIEKNDKTFETKEGAKLKNLLEQLNEINLEAIERIINIVNSLKSFAHLDESEIKQIDLNGEIEKTVEFLKLQINDFVSIEREYGTIPKIKCYVNLLSQVFLNILLNSVQSISENGIIKISTTYFEQKIIITIEDNGTGISKDILPNIFEPGFSTKGTRIGLGLGLSIANNIVKKHNGKIKVASDLGIGTIVTVEIPENPIA